MQNMSKAQKQIAEALEAYKRGELEVFDMDDKFWDGIDAVIEQASRESKRETELTD